jgi:hypothetical protein
MAALCEEFGIAAVLARLGIDVPARCESPGRRYFDPKSVISTFSR